MRALKQEFGYSACFYGTTLKTMHGNITFSKHYQSKRLRNNSLIRIDRRPVLFKEWLAEGILTIKNLVKDATTFLSFEEFHIKCNIQARPLDFIGKIHCSKL